MLAGAAAGEIEREADAPLDAHARVDRPLCRDLVRRALAEEAALPGVRALGVLANDEEVDVRREEEGTEVHVQVQVEAQLEEQATLEDSGRHIGCADGTEEDRVELAQLVDRLVGEDLAGPQVAGAPEVVLLRVEDNARGTRDLDGLGHDIGTDAVAADHGDAV